MSDKSLGSHITELRELIVKYIRQEVTSPLKGAGRYLKRGVIGGVIGIVAGTLATVGLLRVAQTTNVLDIDRGAWSWLVYLTVGIICLVVGGVAVMMSVRSRS